VLALTGAVRLGASAIQGGNVDKELVIIVRTEAAAYDVVKALQDLDNEGSIELYASQVVARADNGDISVLDQRNEQPPIAGIAGIGGALIGLLAGPAGVALGAVVGTTLGASADVGVSGITGDFVNDTAKQLQPGTFAVCASVWEDWMVPVDSAVAPFKGIVLRQATEDVAAAQIKSENQGLKDEWAHFEAEVKNANGEAKKKLEAHRKGLEAKQRDKREQLKQRAAALQARWDAKIKSMDDKLAGAKADAKARHQRHHDQLAQLAQKQKESWKNLFA
jgi:uncharacterized membrane protein